jgi:predicted secreted protein
MALDAGRGLRLLACVLAASLAAGCVRRQAAPAAPASVVVPVSYAEPLTVTEQEAGQAVELEPGQQLVVRLHANRSTGYGWALGSPADGLLVLEGSAAYETSDDGALGSGGTEVWRLRAVQAGARELTFEYRRPFEPGVAPLLRVSYAVTVR